ncbi:MAG TPA: TIGR00730 family Rossman fold protein [Acidobacteriota bacterium]|nr:TIGR00730 family Rossman fold protein [Acidobacteriota bacterium]HNG91482.1 TIGR00730 family Rossman fold protein [Acidobacteriota bacterium]HNJ43593.1 TIGR00730 family Rossman fold protein [Acidobacteriota bacterium]
MNRICVFCGSNPGTNPAYVEAAVTVGTLLASRQIGLVYGGGHVGMMGTIADAVLARGGEAIGVIPVALAEKEVEHKGLTRLHVVKSMHERKALMADLADGFIALPGGFGTFEEYCEIITWAQLGFHHKPCGLLNVAGYYNHLLAMIDHGVDQQFIRPVHRQLVIDDTDAERLLERMTTFVPPVIDKWIQRDET